MNQAGRYLLMVGLVFSIVLGLASESLGAAKGWLYALTILIGFAIGLVNVEEKHSKEFIIAVAALAVILIGGNTIVKSFETLYLIGKYLTGMLESLMLLIVPAGIMAALKHIWNFVKQQQ